MPEVLRFPCSVPWLLLTSCVLKFIPVILFVTLLHGLLVFAVVPKLDQFHLRLSCPPFLFSAKFKLNVSGVRTPTCV